eukprot:gnl/Spiro4/13243_TR7028_c0_g1_i1.p2 gnl/Spiro4/13243_TR7028_c0_g1~~gnl/Spiro4/13243_TR7028_c0_g1_i1.p2  ORF type:complete len:105 (+),score=10.90 gnl/Spiro4/13243_TR7028_c0_g1_i1:38-352(+)
MTRPLAIALGLLYCLVSVCAINPSELNTRRARANCEGQCKTTTDLDAREMCIKQCTSPSCYNKAYGDFELEEGEVDIARARMFQNCLRTANRHPPPPAAVPSSE